MNLLKSKKGGLSPKFINAAVIAIVVLVVLFSIYAAVIPEAQTAGNSLNVSNQCISNGCFYNTTGVNSSLADPKCLATAGDQGASCATVTKAIPFAGLFSGTGVVFVIVMAAMMIVVVRSYLNKGK